MQQLPPAGWYPEPSSPTGQRWWDGAAWTQLVDPSATAAAAAGGQVAGGAAAGSGAGGEGAAAGTSGGASSGAAGAAAGWRSAALITSPVVQISQQGRVIESASVYALADASGAPVGLASQVGQRRGGRLMKAMTDMDRNLQVTIQFADPTGAEVMTLVKPGGVGPQRFAVIAAGGQQIGQINQRIRMVREAFDLVVGGQPGGTLSSQNWMDRRFSALDATGTPFAVVHKRYEGYARAVFTSADEYVVEYAAGATAEQRAVGLASAIAMDIALYSR